MTSNVMTSNVISSNVITFHRELNVLTCFFQCFLTLPVEAPKTAVEAPKKLGKELSATDVNSRQHAQPTYC